MMMNIKQLSASLLLTAGLAVASPLPPADLLAANTVVAEYMGTVHQPCRFRTALCPDRCDHAAELARFRVIRNESYEQPGKYGDDKAEQDSVLLVDAVKDVPGQDDATVHRLISELKPGDQVRLTISHYYVRDKGMHYPVRPVTQMEKL